MALYVASAFSLNMLDFSSHVTLCVQSVDLDTARNMLRNNNFVSAVGHQGTADFLSKLTGVSVPFNRAAVKLHDGDSVLVFQLTTRLEEGKVLSEKEVMDMYNAGAAKFYLVSVGPC